MKKRLHAIRVACFIIIIISFLPFSKSYSQSIVVGNEKTRVEVGINIGPSFFLGDLGGNRGVGTRFIKDLNFPYTQIMAGVFATFYPNEWLGLRVAAQTGKLEAEDNIIKEHGGDELYRKQRNLDFRTNISEAYIGLEVFPFMLLNSFNIEYKPRLRPYGVIGVGTYHFNPQGSLTDANGNKSWYYLRPLHTEGEGFPEYPKRKEYSLTQINFPMGVGLKYYVSDRVNVSFEILLRKSLTDYIDDVSTEYIDPDLFDKYLSPQDAIIARKISDKANGIVDPSLTRNAPGEIRGNPRQNDSYFTTFLKIAVRLGPIFENSYSRSVASHMRCPARF